MGAWRDKLPTMTQTTSQAPAQSGTKVLAILLIVGGALVSFIALVCMLTYFLTQGLFPIGAIGSWNLLIGFVFFVLGTVALIAGIVLLVKLNRAARRLTA